MTTQIRVGIVGYGNLGRGVETAIGLNPDMSLVGVFTRRAVSLIDASEARAIHQVFENDADFRAEWTERSAELTEATLRRNMNISAPPRRASTDMPSGMVRPCHSAKPCPSWPAATLVA